MNFLRSRLMPVAMLAALLCCSCDDPKLVEQREKQKAEMSRLKGELALIDERLKSMPPDVAGDLAETKKAADKQAAEVTALESEVAGLEARKKSLQAEFDAYRLKYQVK